MAIRIEGKDKNSKFRVCVEGKGSSAVKATCDTLEDVSEYLAKSGSWVFIAQGVQALEIDSQRVEIRDRDETYIGNQDELLKFGLYKDNYRLTRRSKGDNPRVND